jgi:hypothetical protein
LALKGDLQARFSGGVLFYRLLVSMIVYRYWNRKFGGRLPSNSSIKKHQAVKQRGCDTEIGEILANVAALAVILRVDKLSKSLKY